MIRLSNGARIEAAYILPTDPKPGMRPNGVVLAEDAHDWVTWEVFFIEGDLDRSPEGYPLWEAQCGHYFQKSMPASQGNPKTMAEFDYGLRVQRLATENIWKGMKA